MSTVNEHICWLLGVQTYILYTVVQTPTLCYSSSVFVDYNNYTRKYVKLMTFLTRSDILVQLVQLVSIHANKALVE